MKTARIDLTIIYARGSGAPSFVQVPIGDDVCAAFRAIVADGGTVRQLAEYMPRLTEEQIQSLRWGRPAEWARVVAERTPWVIDIENAGTGPRYVVGKGDEWLAKGLSLNEALECLDDLLDGAPTLLERQAMAWHSMSCPILDEEPEPADIDTIQDFESQNGRITIEEIREYRDALGEEQRDAEPCWVLPIHAIDGFVMRKGIGKVDTPKGEYSIGTSMTGGTVYLQRPNGDIVGLQLTDLVKADLRVSK